MLPEDQIRTAKAVRYRRVNSPVATTRHASGETCGHITGAMGPPPRPRPRPQNARLLFFSRAGIRGIAGQTTPCGQHTQSINLAQRIRDWELQCPPKTDWLPMGGKRPWRPPSPVWAPARFSWWPPCSLSSSSSSPSPPPRSPSPPLWKTLPRKAQMPGTRFGNLNLYSTPKSPPPRSARLSACNPYFLRTTPEKGELRPHTPPVSAWTAQLRGKATNKKLAEADTRRKQREEDEDAQSFLRGILQMREPQAIFNENFSFGPKTYEDDDDYLPPLSPRSSCSSLPDLCSRAEHKSLKRQRHDSSTADGAAKSPRDRLHSTSSPIPIPQPQSKSSADTSFGKGFGTQEVHPGQLVDFITRDPPGAGRRTEDDVRHVAPDHRLSSIVDSFKDRPFHGAHKLGRERTSTSPLNRLNHCDAHLKNYLMEQSVCKGSLVDNPRKAHEVLDEQAKTRTCDLQRRPRTTRDHAPISSDSLTRGATEEFLTARKTTPVIGRTSTTAAGSSSSLRSMQNERARRRSRVPRCRSTDVFLRTIRESREARMRMKTESGSKREDTLDSNDVDTDWMGDEPL